jgi:predicted DCC family thiol-disulfide oxidoreductase YuxK
MTEMRTPLWLFDGDCGPCDRAAARIRTRVAPPADVRPYQSADLDALGIGPDEVLRGPVLVRPDGSHVVGPQSVAELLRMSRPPFRLAGALMLAPGVRHAFAAVGPHMYQQRYRLPGATAACRTPESVHTAG